MSIQTMVKSGKFTATWNKPNEFIEKVRSFENSQNNNNILFSFDNENDSKDNNLFDSKDNSSSNNWSKKNKNNSLDWDNLDASNWSDNDKKDKNDEEINNNLVGVKQQGKQQK